MRRVPLGKACKGGDWGVRKCRELKGWREGTGGRGGQAAPGVGPFLTPGGLQTGLAFRGVGPATSVPLDACPSCLPLGDGAAESLPSDVWQHISDFLQSPVLSHVCTKTWLKLRGQHLQERLEPGVGNADAIHKWKMQMRTLRLTKKNTRDSATPLLVALRDAPELHTLRLNFEEHQVEDSGVHALAMLKEAPSLHTLHLNLSCKLCHLFGNQMEATGVHAFAALKDAPRLQVPRPPPPLRKRKKCHGYMPPSEPALDGRLCYTSSLRRFRPRCLSAAGNARLENGAL